MSTRPRAARSPFRSVQSEAKPRKPTNYFELFRRGLASRCDLRLTDEGRAVIHGEPAGGETTDQFRPAGEYALARHQDVARHRAFERQRIALDISFHPRLRPKPKLGPFDLPVFQGAIKAQRALEVDRADDFDVFEYRAFGVAGIGHERLMRIW